MTNEEFYKAEAEYWKAEVVRLKELLLKITNISFQTNNGGTVPEPPVNTKYVIETEDGSARAVWEHRADGWYCSADHTEKGCIHCPEQWEQVVNYWISTDAKRILPSTDTTRILPS